MLNVKISLYQKPPLKIQTILDIYDTSKSNMFDIIDWIELPEILGNWNLWIN